MHDALLLLLLHVNTRCSSLSSRHFRTKTEGVAKVRKPKEVRKPTKYGELEGGLEAEGEEGGWEVVRGVQKASDDMTLPEMKRTLFGKGEIEIDHDNILKKRKEVVAGRGKKVGKREEGVCVPLLDDY